MLTRVFFALLMAAALGAADGPLETKSKFVALVFISSECPVSNKMIPEIERLHKKFSKRDTAIWIIYPNASDTDEDIQKHRREYRITAPFARDPNHELTLRAAATITPEAVLFNEKREIIYRGRINDQYLALGKGRPEATEHDLQEAIEAALAGRPPKHARTEPVGCFIQDLK